MLGQKRIAYRRIDLVAGVHRAFVRAFGFPGVTVPALRIDGRRVQGTRAIALALDALVPEPRLVPEEARARDAVLEAEAWADLALQPVPRRLVWAALKRDRSTIITYLEGARLGLPPAVAASVAWPVIRLAARLNRADDAAVRRDLAALPALMDRVDELLAAGVLGGDPLNAADFQVATSVRLLLTLEDVAPLLAGRPAAAHAWAVVPSYPGRMGPVFDRTWLPSLPA